MSNLTAVSKKSTNDSGSCRFIPVPCTPKQLVGMLDYGDKGIDALTYCGAKFQLTPRFHKSLAHELGVPYGVFKLFSPQEVMERAADVQPDLRLRLTVDAKDGKALGVTERRGVPVPVRYVVNTLGNDSRLRSMTYRDGVICADLNLGERWEVKNDSEYSIHVQCRVPVDGVGRPEMNLSTWRQVCENGAIAEAPIFRTKMEIKDNDGSHFARLLKSFSNPEGVELLQERMNQAAETRASVGELYALEEVIRKVVPAGHDQLVLRDRLHEMAANPCIRYGVTELGKIGQKRRGLLPVDCSVSDLLNFASELGTHHKRIISDAKPLHAYTGTLLAKGYDLEDLYPNTQRTSRFYLTDLDLAA